MQTTLESLGSVCAVIGAQWGDEGKGKIIDFLAPHFDVIARSAGGANAGHTVVVRGEKYVFHLLPSGCLHEGKLIVLGSGMVIHLPTLLKEVQAVEDGGVDILQGLFLSPAAHIVFEYHREIDCLLEEERVQSRGEGIGTTRRGIGPAYLDKAARTGFRLELLWENEKTIRKELLEKAREVRKRYGLKVDVDRECTMVLMGKKILEGRLVSNIVDLLCHVLGEGKKILIEGAQGTLLDLDHGTYPHVTSSTTTAAGALQGIGLPPQVMTSCIGVAKAYCTRVGGGLFPTEVKGKIAERLRERGGEYGATTGRPRRCGWLHLPSLCFAAALNGFTHWNITKMDVLDGERLVPVGVDVSRRGKMRYGKLPGWKGKTAGLRVFKDLPAGAKKYIRFIEEVTGIPVMFVGTGQGREDMVVKDL